MSDTPDWLLLATEQQRKFWSKVDVRGPSECWEWGASKNRDGYGRFSVVGPTGSNTTKSVWAHRMAWMLANRQWLGGESVVMHSCDNPPCCNPSHLGVGTHADNVRDKVRKGRNPRGSLAPWALLTEEDVLAIRASTESACRVAEAYGVSVGTITSARSGKRWTHVTTGVWRNQGRRRRLLPPEPQPE